MPHLTLIAAGWFVVAQTTAPDPAALVKEVQAHQEEMDRIRENYTFHRIRRVEELDAQWAVKKTTMMEREIFFVNGHQIGRLVKKDDTPLSPAEDKSEQDRVRKITTRLIKAPPAYGKGGGVNLISLILGVSTISNPRQAEVNGRSTLQFDFEGDPKAEAHDLQSKAARKLAGSIWIDQADRQVARLEVEFYDNFKIGGGLLASIQKGTHFQDRAISHWRGAMDANVQRTARQSSRGDDEATRERLCEEL